MRTPNRRSAILLFAVLLPSTALVGIAVRMLRQEGELAERRALQARRAAIAQAGRELELSIDRIANGAPADSVVVLAAPVNAGTFLLPWESALPQRPVRDSLLLAGNARELASDYARADDLYLRAAHAADPVSRDLALLFRARNAARAGRLTEARAFYQQLLMLPLSQSDEEGMPFALYAADWLSRNGMPRAEIERILQRSVTTSSAPLARVALYGLRAYQHGADSIRTEQHITDAERLVALRRDYLALVATAGQQGGGVWLAYGREPWLVRADSTRVVVVRPRPVLVRSRVQLVQPTRLGAEPLGAAFPGVYASVVGNWADIPSRAGDPLLILVALAIGLTAVSAFILWRDVRREVAVAELRTQFVNSVSHELRTPLAAVRMNSDLLRLGIVPAEDGRECLDTIAHETERLTRLIDNVLDFSRLERGERAYHMQPVDLDAMAADLQRKLAQLLQRDGFDLHVHVDPDLPVIRADSDALTQALMNLLSNAMKFSAEARHIDLAFVRHADDVVIRVTDRGRGISATARPHIFEKFYRAPEVQADGISGAGIGLALVADIARNHGGNVSVESELGRGSTFAITLPARS